MLSMDLAAYANDSSTWPEDNIRALGSEYTSRAWDDRLSPGWGEFVFQAVVDCRASGALLRRRARSVTGLPACARRWQ
jgi:hypothetical protein